MSIPSRSQALNISVISLWGILRKNLALRPYNIALTPELKPTDHFKRRTFANWTLDQMQAYDDFHKKIIFSDEAHFWLGWFCQQAKLSHLDETAEKVDLTLQWDAPASFNYTTKTFCRYRKCHQEQMLRDSIKTIIKEMEKPGIKKHGIIENEWIITDNITDDATMVASFPIPEFVDRNVYIINGLLSYKHYNKYSQLILSPITISFDDLMSKDIELSKDEVLNMNEQAYLGLMSASVETQLVAYFVRRNIRQFYVLFNKLNVVSETKKVFYVDGLTELINSSLLIFEQPLDDIFDLKIYTRNTTSCQQLLRYIYKSVPDALILPKASKNILIKIQEVSNLSGAVSSNVLNSFQNKLKEYLNTIELQIDLVEKFCNIELDKISSDLLKSNEEIGLPVCINEYKKFRSELSKLEKEADVLMDVICKVAEDVNLEGDVGVDDENKDDNNMI